jgi:hypothetical protein
VVTVVTLDARSRSLAREHCGRIWLDGTIQRTGANGRERSPLHRTQEVAGSSPASSIREGRASARTSLLKPTVAQPSRPFGPRFSLPPSWTDGQSRISITTRS